MKKLFSSPADILGVIRVQNFTTLQACTQSSAKRKFSSQIRKSSIELSSSLMSRPKTNLNLKEEILTSLTNQMVLSATKKPGIER